MNDDLANPYQALTRRFLWGLLAVPVFAIGGSLIAPGAGVALGAVALVVALATLGICAWIAASLEGELAALRTGEALARWPIPAPRVQRLWQVWLRQARVGGWVTFAVIEGVALTVAGLFYFDEGAPGLAAGAMGVGSAVGLLVAGGVYLLMRGVPPVGAATLYLRPTMAVVCGRIWRWHGGGFTLLGAQAGSDAEGPTLEIRFEVHAGHGPVPQQVALPAPSKEEAERVAEQLRGLLA